MVCLENFHWHFDFLVIIEISEHRRYFGSKEKRSSEAATRDILKQKLLLKISQTSQENTCARVSFYSPERLQLY